MRGKTHEGDPCKHCGAWGYATDVTCVERELPDAGDKPPRIIAVEDFDFIGKRLAELREKPKDDAPDTAFDLADCSI